MQGTINVFTFISPSVFLRREIIARILIMIIPIHLEIPKYWCIKAPLPAKIIAQLLNKKILVMISVILPRIPGLTKVINSL